MKPSRVMEGGRAAAAFLCALRLLAPLVGRLPEPVPRFERVRAIVAAARWAVRGVRSLKVRGRGEVDGEKGRRKSTKFGPRDGSEAAGGAHGKTNERPRAQASKPHAALLQIQL